MTISVYCLLEEKTIAHMDADIEDYMSAVAANETWKAVSQEYGLSYVEPCDLIQCPNCGGPLSFHKD